MQLIARNQTPSARFDDQLLEDRWAKDLLARKMEILKPTLADRVIKQVARDLVEILQSQNAIDAARTSEAVTHLQQGPGNSQDIDVIPLVATTFTELTKHEMQRTLTIPGIRPRRLPCQGRTELEDRT